MGNVHTSAPSTINQLWYFWPVTLFDHHFSDLQNRDNDSCCYLIFGGLLMETTNCKNVCRYTLEVKKTTTSRAERTTGFFHLLLWLPGVSRTWDISHISTSCQAPKPTNHRLGHASYFPFLRLSFQTHIITELLITTILLDFSRGKISMEPNGPLWGSPLHMILDTRMSVKCDNAAHKQGPGQTFNHCC